MKFLSTVFLVVFSLNASAYTKGKTYKFTVLHTNDHHGRFWANKEGELGLAPRATLIQEIREEVKKEGGTVLLLDAGDVNTGIPQSDLQNAEPDFKGMSLIGYDVMALGNHEFDNPLSTIFQQREWAKFPFVSANIYDKKTGKRVFPPFVNLNADGLKITVLGLTTEDTPMKSRPHNTKDLLFKPAVEEAKLLVPEIRPNADVLIALTHMGHYPNEAHGRDAPGDVTLARKVNGIDIIVGGHTQKPLFEPDIQNGSIIVQAYEWGKYLGRIDLEFLDGKLTLKDYKLIPVNLKDSKKSIKPHDKLLSFLRPFKEKGDKSLLVKLGTAEGEFFGTRDIIRKQETNLGNLVTRAYREKFGAHVGLSNSGGIRDSILPGDITMETILTVLPFGGEIVTAELTGEELKKYIAFIVVHQTPGSGSFPQLSGVEVSMEKNKIKSLKVNGKEVEAKKRYSLALPEFIANGGDKYPVISHRKYGHIDADILKEYIQAKKTVRSKDYAPTGYIRGN
jgi:5'-nucleotidase/UDP-sugar diphosphatase